jgi:hypothetical protein
MRHFVKEEETTVLFITRYRAVPMAPYSQSWVNYATE